MTAPGPAARAAALERLRLSRGIAFLPAIATTAPMLGTLGTLVTMTQAIPPDVSSLGTVAQPGVSEVLIPVVFGLAVAIVARILYGCLFRRAVSLAGEADYAARVIRAVFPKPTQPKPFPTRMNVELARSAALRAAANEQLRMKRRFRHLPDVVSLAPWVGLMGTSFEIALSFPGVTGDKSSMRAILFANLSEALLPTAAALAIATFAYCLYHRLLTQTESLALEMETVADAFAARARSYLTPENNPTAAPTTSPAAPRP